MAIEKMTTQDAISIVDMGDWKNLQIRTATIIKDDDGSELSRTFHRHSLNPNSDISSESDEVKELAERYFTSEAKAKHKAQMEENAGPLGEINE
jgi:hypothetical protein